LFARIIFGDECSMQNTYCVVKEQKGKATGQIPAKNTWLILNYTSKCDFRHPPRCWWDLRSSGILRSVEW
jgi:hypothetical protein